MDSHFLTVIIKNQAEIINRVILWFNESTENNIIYTFYNEKENKDVYMVALRVTIISLSDIMKNTK